MTAGDLGTATRSRAAISRIRKKEAAASAKLLGAAYTCLGFDDLTIVYNAATKRRVSALLRLVRPDLVIVPSPVDYMADHEETPRIVREAAFASTVPNWKASLRGQRPRPCAKLPAILYADPIDNVDHFGRRVPAQYVVDITGSVDLKEQMLARHESQRSWLRDQHGEDEYLLWMRRVGADRARDFGRAGVKYAEGFRQHLGHGFPREDHLTASLGERLVKALPWN
jgi:LmbE family N-acetylglucosaminyl deacetylase